MGSVRRAWAASRKDAELDQDVVLHALRHTAASWGVQNAESFQDLHALAGYIGMSLELLLNTYGHLSPIHQRTAANTISRRMR
ncbi:hypothetical protein [Labrenzia sp. PHM005]|uniref:hypothetical protein n=1 Tax=Labrenzia sp. PHM005 TaxID=2590016 RepID=UPI00114034A2|nr:hypothetical protein [Labrenzia sp. PHM005]QDG77268.1 hypothetical protein FJ695_16080 [Labrenzia sp. PHM005]